MIRAVALFLLVVLRLSAQEETPVFRATTELVLADVQVVNARTGAPAAGLQARDLRVFEDGAPQEIAQFSHDEMPLSVVLLFDLTESVRGVLKHLAEGAKDALGHLKPQDDVAVLDYGETVRMGSGFTTDREQTVAAIGRASALKINEDAYFNEAIYQAALLLRSTPPSHRRAIIWFTDNYPNVPFRHPAHTEIEAIREVHEAGVTVAPILMKAAFAGAIAFGAGMSEKKWAKDYPPGDANKYAELTGAHAIGLRGGAADAKLRELIDDLRSRYTVGFHPAAAKPPGTFCTLRVELAPDSALKPKEWVVRARQGYYRK
jgi:VWFA-related protein